MKNKSIVVISIFAVVALFFGAWSFYNDNESEKLKKFSSSGEPFIRAHSPSFGDNKKGVVVVEFLDPECEACAYFYPFIKQVFKDHYEDIKLVYRYLDNHKNSKYVVKILESARKQDKYKESLEVIFKNQNKWALHNNEKPQLLWQYLSEIEGMNIEKLKKDSQKINVDLMLSQDRLDAAKLGVQGTPTIFVNGKKLKRLSEQSLYDLVVSEIYK